MAHSGGNKARRPLPPLPYQDDSTGTEYTPPATSRDPEYAGTHMYHYIDKDEISKLRQTGKQRKHEEQPSRVGADSLPVTVGQKVVGLVHNGTYAAGALQQEDSTVSLPTMSTTEKEPRQMAQSGHNKARRPLPPLPSQGVTTGTEFTPAATSGDPEYAGTHMYHYIDIDDISKLRQTGKQLKHEEQPSSVGADSLPVTVGQKVVGLVHNGTYAAGALQQEDSKGIHHQPDTSDSHMNNYVDKDDIKNLRQPPADTGTDSTAPNTTDCHIHGLVDNQMYVPGALRQDTNDTANICGFSTRCKMAFHRSKVFIIIVIAAVAFLGTGAGIIVHFTATPGGQADIHMPFVMANWTPSKPVTTTNVTATYPPVILTNAHSSATRPHLAASMFPPSIGRGTAYEFMLITAAQTTSHDVVTTELPRVTTTLPQGTIMMPGVTTEPPKTTTLPQATTTPPQVTTTLPQGTTTLPRVITTLPQGTITLPQVTATPPQVTTTLPQGTTTLPQGTTTLPQGTTTLPQVTITLPQVTVTPPQVTTTLPQATTTQPQVTTTLPQATTTLPRVITTLSKGTTTLPQVTITLPQVTATLPQSTTTPPQATATLPRVITTLPQGTTTLPQGTAMLPGVTTGPTKTTSTPPQVTSKQPLVTSTLPQVPTTPPKMTTTLQCSKLTPPAHGAVTGSNSYRDVATFTCDPGYKMVGTSSLTCQSDGTWSGRAPTCKAVKCLTLTPPVNGHMRRYRIRQGGMRFTCHRGYKLVGAKRIRCHADRTWSGSVPTCQAVQCAELTPPAHGTMTGSFTDVVTFTCDPRYKLVGASSLTCQSDGTWSGGAPTCTVIQCPALTPPVNGNMRGSRFYPGVMNFGCDRGYNRVGARSIRCGPDGTWSSRVPSCQGAFVQCPTLTPPVNGDMRGSSSYQGVMRFTCNRGYNLVGARSTKCQADGTWNGSVPTCQERWDMIFDIDVSYRV
ncbi:uncharacterized protein [Branchiostoma lanceolatum]|uniref:uncharacterized protein n=1 Tax=Branchiostoma lanceolatum TaxID=7740 RepID=UPI003451D80E